MKNQNGLLILNEDSMQPKDWEKAQYDEAAFEAIESHYQVIRVPLITQTLKAVEALGLSKTEAKKSKNYYILGMVLWLFDLSLDACRASLMDKFQDNPHRQAANEAALSAGYNYALTLELIKRPLMPGLMVRELGDYRQITGVEAVAWAIAAVAQISQTPTLVAGYPITPSSAILQACTDKQAYGVKLFQAEDEISAICACIGAAFGGALAITSTSGPGLDLKSESLGLAVISELPLVILDVQRAGASTGLPTKTGQSDLNQALYGRHGEAPLRRRRLAGLDQRPVHRRRMHLARNRIADELPPSVSGALSTKTTPCATRNS